ncbi:MAG: hypothetical protein ACR2GQ_01825 [Gemmatimonadota bacterium]
MSPLPILQSHMLDDVPRILGMTPEDRLIEVRNFSRLETAVGRANPRVDLLVAGLEDIIRSKVAADRPQDRQDVLVLREMLRRRAEDHADG